MSKLAFSMIPNMVTLKDGTEVQLLIKPVWYDLALVRYLDGQEEFISMDQIKEDKDGMVT